RSLVWVFVRETWRHEGYRLILEAPRSFKQQYPVAVQAYTNGSHGHMLTHGSHSCADSQLPPLVALPTRADSGAARESNPGFHGQRRTLKPLDHAGGTLGYF
ncbi:hypothetical protein AAFF_G00001900, partial [Aldrovandia affinis]